MPLDFYYTVHGCYAVNKLEKHCTFIFNEAAQSAEL